MDKPQILFYKLLKFFFTFQTNVLHHLQGQIWCQNQGQKVIATKRADSVNFLTELQSLSNFLQSYTGTEFVEISLEVANILRFEFWQVPPFLPKL